jgi:hypothetical protein
MTADPLHIVVPETRNSCQKRPSTQVTQPSRKNTAEKALLFAVTAPGSPVLRAAKSTGR